jgi:hypothetical protein
LRGIRRLVLDEIAETAESPSSPTGVSRLMASWAILRMLRTLSADISIFLGDFFGVGSRP